MADESRIENILDATLGEPGAEVPSPPFSRIEEKLIELKEAIESGGGGGGGTTNYNALTNKPSINGHTLQGNSTLDTLGIASKPTLDAAIEELDDKVDKVTGKGLSTNDFTNADKTDLSTALAKANAAALQSTTYTKSEVNAALGDKVDKVTGKGLSTNDFTNADKTKLEGIESGAEANVQADWTQTDTSADDYIKNKPTIPSPVTVDQTYSATSANAQSGVAVASALTFKQVADPFSPTMTTTAPQDFTNVTGGFRNGQLFAAIATGFESGFAHTFSFLIPQVDLGTATRYPVFVNGVYCCDITFYISENIASLTIYNYNTSSKLIFSNFTLYALG